MRAGSLRYILEMIAEERKQSPSGAVRVQQTVVYKAKAQKVKQLQRYDKDGYTAKEQFNGESLVFKVRNDKRIKDIELVRFNGALFRITLKDYNVFDNSVSLTLIKKDE